MADGITAQLWGGVYDGQVVTLPPGPPPMAVNLQGGVLERYRFAAPPADRAPALPVEVYDRVPLSLAAALLGRRAHVMVYVHRPLVDRWAGRGQL